MPQRCDAAWVCEAAMRAVRPTCERKRQSLDCTAPASLVLRADPRRLEQMLTNLLSNAAKFTPQGGSISLSVVIDEAERRARFSVRDTGIGIAPEAMQLLFRPFHQLDGRLSRRYSGTGLGLSLVRRLAEMHGGTVEASSEEGKGSCFTIALPAEPAAAPPPCPTAQQPEERAPLLLLADDDELGASAVQLGLERRGFEVLRAVQGDQVIALVERSGPDLVLMDLQLPVIDGLEATRRIRAHRDPAVARTPIVVLTGSEQLGDRERSLAAGADDHLTKPVTRAVLLATIEAHRRRAGAPLGEEGELP